MDFADLLPPAVRQLDDPQTAMPRIAKDREWFRQIWTGLPGASTKDHPAPFPVELAERVIRTFSFVGDTVLDPFMGTASTNIAAAKWGRNRLGVEVDEEYYAVAEKRLRYETTGFFWNTSTTCAEVRGDGKTRKLRIPRSRGPSATIDKTRVVS